LVATVEGGGERHKAMIKLLLDYSSVDVNPDDDGSRTLL
jgi:hypothetical protein